MFEFQDRRRTGHRDIREAGTNIDKDALLWTNALQYTNQN